MIDPLVYYAQPGAMTDPREHGSLFADLPRDVASLCKIVQGLMIHVFWADRYGLKLPQERQAEVQLRPVARKLAHILELDARPLIEARPLEKKLVGNCRDHTVLMIAMLRSLGVPARARCGFGTYFLPNHYEDHWVVEYWNAEQNRWILVDAQLDAFQRDNLKIDFDPLDVPRNRFIVGGKAWQMCRTGQADPQSFGIFNLRGLWFVRGDFVRDVAALNRIELLPWDGWGLINATDDQLTSDDLALLDRIAALTSDEVAFDEVRAAYDNDARLRVPRIITTYLDGGAQSIDLENL